LHPAHVLTPGTVSVGAGASGQFALRSVGTDDSQNSRLEQATVAPGVAPWVGGRIGIEGSNEAGLTYTARAVRLDGRHAFELGDAAISVGVGANVIVPQRPGRDDSEARLYGGGFDVPLLFGFRTRSDLYAMWFGPRAGFSILGGSVRSTEPVAPGAEQTALDFDARHFQVGLVAGVRAGFRHLHVAVELDGAYHYAEGTIGEDAASIDQVSLTPAGALVLTF
jgi:hypothetical protein